MGGNRRPAALPVTGVGLFIHGGGEAAAHAALAVAEALDARAFATGSGESLTTDSARCAAGAWQAHRDRVVSP
ncbi:hypothetical protein [Streptomyces sp. NPDC002537]